MRRLGLGWAVLLAAVACGGGSVESPTAPKPPVVPPDSVPNVPPSTPRIVLYAVPQRHAGGTTSNVRARMVRDQAGGVTQEPWNADSIVYVVGDSTGYPPGNITLDLMAQVKDFGTKDSAGVPNAQVQWVVTYGPQLSAPYGLASTTTTTDAVGATDNKFVFTMDMLGEGNGDGKGYAYVEARLADSTGAFIKQATFYVLAWQQPVVVLYFDGKAPVGGPARTWITPDVPYDVAQHVTLPLVEGGDQLLTYLPIDHLEVSDNPNDTATPLDGCTVVGTVITCTADALNQNPVVNIWIDFKAAPPGINPISGADNPSGHTWVELRNGTSTP